MILNSDSAKPIYVQIAEWLENEIIAEHFKDDEKIYSQYQLAELFNINPATAAKGLTILVEEEILYKKRGLGMFVATEAKAMILAKRRDQTLTQMVSDLVMEAKRLSITKEELIQLIHKCEEEV
ncbi:MULTISPECIES: GntR family transcriptional regulator [unclassified Psychrobacillus]|uniref:GntR family transcriptional regulator n=1 Tax=unclassified Psychrobacillus TaxID=2636677 RepID=UPI00146ED112|nr:MULTISPECIES: GntR family transcriptional regulator [unclassified Psychrobacillus]MCM3360134.1 GntR family transcriptional regulator [Psychrobacillus sp. MER TA 171]NME07416.1 GntR family transcriptional regulator [Psychrobacillus sp. BL-248-WT-3]